MSCGIYCITNTCTNDHYVGKASNLDNRWRTHTSQLIREIHFNPLLQQAWNKHGKDAFTFEVLEAIERHLYYKEAGAIEIMWIQKLSPAYNLRVIGKTSETSKNKSLAGIQAYWEWRRNNNLMSPQSIQGISWREVKALLNT